jgi:hypothetical protein
MRPAAARQPTCRSVTVRGPGRDGAPWVLRPAPGPPRGGLAARCSRTAPSIGARDQPALATRAPQLALGQSLRGTIRTRPDRSAAASVRRTTRMNAGLNVP